VRTFAADLHVHTVLSPCGADEMTPPAVVEAALRRGLDMIAVCDHNSARNAPAVREAARGVLAVLHGMEITTAEEVHVLGLFPDAEAALAAGEEVRATLPEADGAARRRFGEQTVCDAEGRAVGRERKLLAAASGFALPEAVRMISRHGGLAVAAHVDRPSFSVFSQLGLFPADAGFDAVEISATGAVPAWAGLIAALTLPRLHSSDAHFLEEIGKGRTSLRLEEPTFPELARALAGAGGRAVL
jgi:3',5'-nucleoside bisphosphate phosphatase